MLNENFQNKIIKSIKYRSDLVEKIKKEPDKIKRKEIISSEMASGQYLEAKQYHRKQTFIEENEDSLNKICVDAKSYNELIELIEKKKNLFIYNKNYGVDHFEHIIKRLKMAREIHDIDLIPVEGGLKEMAVSLLFNEGTNFDPELKERGYEDFLRKNYPNLQLNDYELKRIADKLSPEIFASVDIKIENIILLLNSLEGTNSTFSCSGHFEYDYGERGEKEFFGLSLNPYVSFDTDNQELIYEMENVKNSYSDLRIEDKEGTESREVIITEHLGRPPLNWIKENNKMSDQEIINESKKLLNKYFNTNIFSSCSNDNELYKRADELQKEMLINNPSKALSPTRGTFLLEIYELLPIFIEEREYSDYYYNNMQDVIDKRDLFISSIEALLMRVRRKENVD